MYENFSAQKCQTYNQDISQLTSRVLRARSYIIHMPTIYDLTNNPRW